MQSFVRKLYPIFLLFIGSLPLNALQFSAKESHRPKECNLEEMFEIIYTHYLVNRYYKNPITIGTKYKYILLFDQTNNKTYKDTLPTIYELTFHLKDNNNQTYTLEVNFTPQPCNAEQAQEILQLIQQGKHPIPAFYKDNVYAFMSNYALNYIVNKSPCIKILKKYHEDFYIVNNEGTPQMFKPSSNTVCSLQQDGLAPSFKCNCFIKAERINEILRIFPPATKMSNINFKVNPRKWD